ncbi:hypothetical protein BpHYR1_012588 [Brachionus plicatilis]|uniref:Uncharacterized protein n=1 Tax=Brachionus plicatilis TaxID=10195 RepID=A0A3M7T2B8_BRAPC|nr:hypothetical protein BpHYR1_012588 [Brachionus plicatilis]
MFLPKKYYFFYFCVNEINEMVMTIFLIVVLIFLGAMSGPLIYSASPEWFAWFLGLRSFEIKKPETLSHSLLTI